jgi:cytochrome P450
LQHLSVHAERPVSNNEKVVRIRPNEVTLGNPKDYRDIYDTKSRYDKTEYFKRFTIYGEDNLFSTVKYYDHQAKKRKIAAPYAKSNVVANAEGLVRERVRAFITEMIAAPNGLVDFFVLFDCYAHDVMTRFLYGPSHGTDAILDPNDRPLVVNLKRAQIWTPLWINFGWFHGSWVAKMCLGEEYRRTVESNGDVRRAIEKKLQEHDEDPSKDEEYSLYRTMRRSKVEGDHLSRNYMASEMYDHLKAGQQTTASTLTYICWRLSRHLEWQRRLQEELRALKQDAAGNVSLNEIEACPVLDAIVKETLRLHPAASGRQERVVPVGGRTYSGIFIPGGTTVIGPTLVLHHNASAFPDPHSWRPDRWLAVDEAKLKEMELSFVPFGHGARICIGQHLATMEIRLLVSSIYMRFSTKLSETCTDDSMKQLGALAAVPKGLRCELFVEEV